MAAKKCLICSSSFSGRRDAKTCSSRCRKRLQLVRGSFQGATLYQGRTLKRQLSQVVAVVVFGLFGLAALLMSGGPTAQAATSSYFNFQMRLLTSSGAVVSDGNYHIEFKLYKAANSTGSSQGSCTGDANCLWTETRTTGNLVRVVNGYFSVQLGSVTALPSINWNQELWLGVRIGGSGGTASWEANELTSDGTATGNKIALTAVPYAFTARELQMTSGSFTNTLLFATPSGSSKTITIPNETGTVCTTGSVCSGYQAAGTTTLQNAYDAGAAGDQVIALDPTQDSIIIRNPSISGSDSTYILTLDQLSTGAFGGLSIQSAGTGNLLVVTDTTATARDVLTIANGGATTFRNQTDSTAALQVQNATGETLFSFDTSNSSLNVFGIGTDGNVSLTTSTGGSRPGIDFTNNTGSGYAKIWQYASGGGLAFCADTTTNCSDQNITLNSSGQVAFQNRLNGSSAFKVQNTSSANILNVDTTNSTNLVITGDWEASSTNWSAKGSSTLSQATAQQWQGNGSMQVATTTAANDGAKYSFNPELGASTQYTLSLYAKVSSGSITDVNIGRQDNGVDIDCLTGQTVNTNWTRFTCTFTTGGTISGSSIYIKKTGTSAETFFVDGIQLQTGATATAFNPGGALQLQGIINSPAVFQNKQDSATAFQIQNAAGTTTLFATDTTNAQISSTGFSSLTGGLTVSKIATPAAPTVTNIGTAGTTSYSYAVTARNANGGETPASAATTTTTGNATLDGTNFNRISWIAIAGAKDYRVYRTASGGTPASTGLVGTTTALTFDDTGIAGGAASPSTDSSGLLTASTALFKNATDSSTAFQIQNAAGNNFLLVDTSGASVAVGNTGIASTVQIGTTTGAVTQTINIGNNATASSTTNVNIGSSIAGTAAITGPTTITNRSSGASDTFNVSNSTSTGTIAIFKDNTTAVATIADGGAITLINQTDSTAGFQVQKASAAKLFVVDTTNSQVEIGDATADGTGVILVLDTKNTSGDPTGVNGAMYYNSNTGAFRCYQAGYWRDCINNPRTSFYYSTDLTYMCGGGNNCGTDMLQNNFVGSGTQNVNIDAEPNRPGLLQQETGTTTTGSATVGTFGSILLGNNDVWYYEASVRIPTLSDGTNTFTYFSGFSDNNTADATDGCYFRYSNGINSGKWQGVCRNNSIESTCDTGITVGATTWYRLNVVVNGAGNSTDFLTDGVSRCQVTSNIPTGTGRSAGYVSSIVKSAGTTERTVTLDYMEVRGDLAASR